jgi:very-short-patch-repair endonuclease
LLRTVDMGWEDYMVAAEYDGDQHRTDRRQYVKDMRILPLLERLGWIIVRVIKEDRRDEAVQRAWDAMVSRGWRPT